MAKATIPYSDRGVLNTLFGPCLSNKSFVHLKTPPKATSSPKTYEFLFSYKNKSNPLLIA